MINLNFLVDDKKILYSILEIKYLYKFKDDEVKYKDCEVFINSLLEIEKKLGVKQMSNMFYYLLSENETDIKDFMNYFDFTGHKQKELFKIIDELLEIPEFLEIKRETEEYKNRIEKMWEKNEKTVTNYFQKTLGYNKTSNTDTFILSTRYSVGCGISNEDSKFILWGYNRCLENEILNVMYLSHEILHTDILPYLPNMDRNEKDIIHSLINFLADKELYHQLTGESYLVNFCNIGLEEKMKQMYPFFLGFLYKNDENPEEKVRQALLRDYKASQNIQSKNNELKDVKFLNISPKKVVQFFKDKKDINPYKFCKLDFSKGEQMFSLDSWELPINFKTTKNNINHKNPHSNILGLEKELFL